MVDNSLLTIQTQTFNSIISQYIKHSMQNNPPQFALFYPDINC